MPRLWESNTKCNTEFETNISKISIPTGLPCENLKNSIGYNFFLSNNTWKAHQWNVFPSINWGTESPLRSLKLWHISQMMFDISAVTTKELFPPRHHSSILAKCSESTISRPGYWLVGWNRGYFETMVIIEKQQTWTTGEKHENGTSFTNV